jgi:hypothetical protein
MWVNVAGWPYSVNHLGHVRNDRTGRLLTPMHCGQKRKQYSTVLLCMGYRQVQRKVHLLVLEAFVGPRPKGMLGLHKDDDTFNNRLSNLYWGTHRDNALDHAPRTASLSHDDVRLIRRLRAQGVAGRVVADQFRISQQMVCDIFKRRCYSQVS